MAKAAVRQAALDVLSEGGWSYMDIVKEYMTTLRVYAVNATVYFEGKLAERLWDTLMVKPPNKEDMLPATQVSSLLSGRRASRDFVCA